MTADPLLSPFPSELLRLILCGGDGLQAAYGPLRFIDPHHLDRKEQDAVWSGSERLAYFSDADDCAAWGMDAFGSAKMEWRLPLDHWRPRLALIAGRLLDLDLRFAPWVGRDGPTLFIAHVFISTAYRRHWDVQTGAYCGVFETIDLPTLPAHLHTHDPDTALLLAIWDATEGRDR